jgi:hypothetical protein
MFRRLPFALLLLGSALGCSLDVGQPCTAIFVYGLNVEVRDSATGIPAGNGATVLATSGTFVEQLVRINPPTDSLTFVGAGERRGVYIVSVEKPGYRYWQSDLVSVAFDGCHVVPVSLDVRLRPLPPE